MPAPLPNARLAGSTSPDGAFSIRDVTPGDYAVSVFGLKGTYLKSVVFDSADVLNGGLHVTEGPKGVLEVVLGTNPGTIEGRALNPKGEASVHVTVTLTPDAARRHRADLYRTTQTDASGRYQFQDLAPGDYMLFAWEDVEPGAWQEDRGKPVRVVEGSKQTLDAAVIR